MDRHRIIKSCLTLKRSEKIWDIRNQTSCEQANAVLFRHEVKEATSVKPPASKTVATGAACKRLHGPKFINNPTITDVSTLTDCRSVTT